MKIHTRRVADLLHRDIYDAVPLFLCPTLFRPSIRPSIRSSPSARRQSQNARPISSSTRRRLELRAPIVQDVHREQVELEVPLALPLCCPGCGAPTQTLHPKEAGFYTTTRKTLKRTHVTPARQHEGDVFDSALKQISKRKAAKLGIEVMQGNTVESSFTTVSHSYAVSRKEPCPQRQRSCCANM
jgi:hypothetical protein